MLQRGAFSYRGASQGSKNRNPNSSPSKHDIEVLHTLLYVRSFPTVAACTRQLFVLTTFGSSRVISGCDMSYSAQIPPSLRFTLIRLHFPGHPSRSSLGSAVAMPRQRSVTPRCCNLSHCGFRLVPHVTVTPPSPTCRCLPPHVMHAF